MVDVANADVLAVLTRAPASGGKTRLFAALGRPPDSALLEALLLDTVDGASDAGLHLVVAVDPPAGIAAVSALLPRAQVVPQSSGTLGDRMFDLMQMLFAARARRVVLVGSDLPTITGDSITEAIAALDTDPRGVVLGPTSDGGYYLIAAAHPPAVFGGVDWSTPQVLRQTLDAAVRAGLRTYTVASLADVDTEDDLRRVAAMRPESRTARWIRRNLPEIRQ